MADTKHGRRWLKTLAARVAQLQGEPVDDGPIAFRDFDSMLAEIAGTRRRWGHERSQGPNDHLQNALGCLLLSKWYQADNLGVDHDAEGDRAIRLLTLDSIWAEGQRHVWVDPSLHGAWIESGAGAGMRVDPVEFDCRHLTGDELIMLTEGLRVHAFHSPVRWNFRCTPAQIATIVAGEVKGGGIRLPYVNHRDTDAAPIESMRRQIGSALLDRAERIMALFEAPRRGGETA